MLLTASLLRSAVHIITLLGSTESYRTMTVRQDETPDDEDLAIESI